MVARIGNDLSVTVDPGRSGMALKALTVLKALKVMPGSDPVPNASQMRKFDATTYRVIATRT